MLEEYSEITPILSVTEQAASYNAMDGNLSRGYCQLRSQKTRMSGDVSSNLTSDPHNLRLHSAPSDRCSCIYLALILCGAGFLLPYNSFITAVDYYQDKFPGTTIIFDMSLTYICIAFFGVLLNNFFVELLSLRTRITFGYILSFVTLLSIALCDIWFEMFDKQTSYWLTLVAVAIVALGCTVQQSSFYGYTSMLPQRYTQAVMTGESAAGLLISINRILTKALLDDERINTIIFFFVSVGIVLACFVIFHVTTRSEFARYYVTMCANAGLADDERGITAHASNPEEVSLVDILDGAITRDNYGVLVISSPTTPPVSPMHDYADNPNISDSRQMNETAHQARVDVKSQNYSFRRHLGTVDAIKRGLRNRWQAARSVWPYMVSIAVAYFVTLCLFPGIESEIISCDLGSWMPVIIMGIFNLFDFIGKIVASINYDWPRVRLVLLTLCRLVLVPLMMMCVTPRARPTLHGEFWPLLISALLGVTNGYFGSVPMILASGKVPDEQKELTGNIMTLSYSIGLTTGSAAAYLLDAWLGPRLTYDPCLPVNVTDIVNPQNVTQHLVLIPGF